MISRCLSPFAHRISTLPREQWADIVNALPERCPHNDCSPNASCRKLCADWARVQWRLQDKRTSIPKTREARAAHLKELLGDLDAS